MMQRKLLFYTHGLTGGGAERVWALLASGFAACGHEVIFAVDYASPENAAFLDPSIRVETLGRNHAQAIWHLSRLMVREKPDASLSALGISNLKHFIGAALAGRLRRAILSYHGYCESEPRFLSRLAYFLTPVTTRLCARTICVSDGLRTYVTRAFRADAKRTVRIYNPVLGGPAPTTHSKAEIGARDPLVLACGRMVPYKNFSMLVRAFARGAPQRAQLVILGEGPDRPNIEAEVVRCGLRDRVSLPGYMPQPWPYYARATCFVSSSQSESFGLAVVEALAQGLPVIATDCDGPREVLQGGCYGTIVPLGDETALASGIARALADPGDPAPRIERARAFSVETGVAEYEGLIEQILVEAEQGQGATPRRSRGSANTAVGT